MNELRREGDNNKFYKCACCGRINHATLTMKGEKGYECLWRCLPFLNSVKGWLLDLKENKNE